MCLDIDTTVYVSQPEVMLEHDSTTIDMPCVTQWPMPERHWLQKLSLRQAPGTKNGTKLPAGGVTRDRKGCAGFKR